MVRVAARWHRLPRQAGHSPLLEISRSGPDAILCNVLWDDPAGVGRWDRMNHCDLSQPHSLCEGIGRFRGSVRGSGRFGA